MNRITLTFISLVLLLLNGCKLPVPREADAILAISWQPAFCESKSRKKECRSQTKERFDASHFTLHGLWPQPRSKSYCDVSNKDIQRDKRGKWMQISRLELSGDLRAELQQVMPGMQSGLQRHEWVKHGSCYADTPTEYYTDSLDLMTQINGSAMQKLFANNIGMHVNTTQIRAAMDESFGEGSGARIRVKCNTDQNSGRRLIVEITLALAGHIGGGDIGKLMRTAFPDNKKGCPGGIIDPVGQQ